MHIGQNRILILSILSCLKTNQTQRDRTSHTLRHTTRGALVLPVLEDYQLPEETSKNMMSSLPWCDLGNLNAGERDRLLCFLPIWKDSLALEIVQKATLKNSEIPTRKQSYQGIYQFKGIAALAVEPVPQD